MSRVSQQAARYTPLGSNAESCGRCRFYMAPASCGRIVGPVSPRGWCKYYSREMVQTWGGSTLTGAGGPSLDLDFMNGVMPGTGAVFTRASAGWAYGATGVLTSFAANVPRFDYDPVTLQPKGLLLEDTSTNIWLQSADASNPAWNKAASGGPVAPVATANQTVAPDGTSTAASVVYPAVNVASSYSVMYQGLPTTASSYALSVWLKGAVGGERVYVTILSGYGPPGVATLTTQWQRFTYVTPGVVGAGTQYFMIGTDLRDGAQASTPAQTIYAWGAQVEAIGYMTSYIPTTTAAVTRAADALSYPIASVTGFDQTKGSLMLEYILEGAVTPSYNAPAQFVGASSATDFIDVDEQAYPNLASLSVTVGGTVITGAGYGTLPLPLNVVHKGAASWAINAFINGAHDGSAAASTSGPAASLPVIVALTVAGPMHYQAPVSQWARRVRYWPRQLSQAELISVTT